jgi:PhnB protein
MKNINSYLIFNGNCREAMTFYADCLGAELTLSTYGEMPGATTFAGSPLILHAHLQKGDVVVMASDTTPDKPIPVGANVQMNINCDSPEEVDQLFAKFNVNAKVHMAPGDTFWNAYFAMIQDQFGNSWMFNFEKPKAA